MDGYTHYDDDCHTWIQFLNVIYARQQSEICIAEKKETIKLFVMFFNAEIESIK